MIFFECAYFTFVDNAIFKIIVQFSHDIQLMIVTRKSIMENICLR